MRIDEQFAVLREQSPGGDPADIGSAEEQRQWQLRVLEREKIGLRRLLLRPTATLCIEAKERQEQRERHLRDT